MRSLTPRWWWVSAAITTRYQRLWLRVGASLRVNVPSERTVALPVFVHRAVEEYRCCRTIFSPAPDFWTWPRTFTVCPSVSWVALAVAVTRQRVVAAWAGPGTATALPAARAAASTAVVIRVRIRGLLVG